MVCTQAINQYFGKKLKSSEHELAASTIENVSTSTQCTSDSDSAVAELVEKTAPVQLIDCIANDISKKGEPKSQLNFQDYSFPKDNDGRRFQPKWFQTFEWIEYSKQKDRLFCYPCRQFSIVNAKDAFTSSGFNSWKTALSAGKGLKRHETSSNHIGAMLAWKDSQS